MKKLFAYFKNAILFLWTFRKRQKFKKVNKILKKSVVDQSKERNDFLKNEFRFFLRKYLKRDSSGTYIPLTGKNKAEIYETVMHKYGDTFKRLNLTFTQNLEIK